MFSFKKKNTNQNENQPVDLKERLFFHDIINHTHGLMLYLHQKESSKDVIHTDEIKMILNEIKTLQSLVRDHYDFKHKNLVQTLDWVPFSYAKFAFHNLVQTYLGHKNVMTSFDMHQSDDQLIYYPSFYRILNNLIKNISESNSTHVKFEFSMDERGMTFISKNEMKISNSNEILEHLARVILNEKTPKVEGLGLESIHHLAEENGGDFNFEITDGVWINKLFLPAQKNKSDKKAA